jgi:hypothetical protein
MGDLSTTVWLGSAYAAFLVAAAYGLDLLARRASRHTTDWRSGTFRYHEDHDAWVCPEDQWLWPEAFDPENRVMRYRANPTVCNNCPVKQACTGSDSGREVIRNVDPWPHSEAGRFHRGIACSATALAVLLPLALAVGRPVAEAGALVLASLLAAVASWPLWRHLRRSPAGFPDHVARQPALGLPAEPSDRFATRWGSFPSPKPESASQPEWKRSTPS